MPNSNKYELFLGELDFLETQIVVLNDRHGELYKKYKLAENQVKSLKSENEYLRSQIELLEKDIKDIKGSSFFPDGELLSDKERLELKEHLNKIIGKIDSYLANS